MPNKAFTCLARGKHLAWWCIALATVLLFAAVNLPAQRNRITERVDNSRRAVLAGHVHPRALPENDQGRVDPSMQLSYVTLVLKPSPGQQTDLEQLLAQQQDPASPNYHRWLTPEDYADRFGASADDVSQIVSWLQSQNLKIVAVARGRNWVAFSGSASRVEAAFRTELHHYLEGGKMHFANATEPSIPAAFENVVAGIHGLSDFRMHPPKRSAQIVKPDYTSSRGSHYLAPDDVATIYDIQPLYSAGIDGTGQKIVVVGQTQIALSDIDQYRSYFGLTANDPQVMLVPNTTDPGTSSSDLPEADLDLELAGAVARNASIIFVYSADVTDAAQYAIDQNLAPVLSMSYGQCEAQTPASDARTLQSWAQQANAQGITWIAASGDSGAADCFDSSSRTGAGLSVDLPGSIPEVTGIGGSEFNEGSGTYWNTTNGTTRASVRSYIPETSWNDSAVDGSPSSSGGGASVFFTKPTWQTGTGVPNDGARDAPDVALSASADHDGFMIYSGGSLQIVGGTSVGAPTFAGMAALLNHYLVSRGAQSAAGLGNMNPQLYSLAQTTPGAFHDIITGDNMVDPCPARARNCTATPIGFSAGPGYDQVTGLGSIDAYNLVSAWHASALNTRAAAAIVLSSNARTLTAADSTLLTATITSSNGATPTGSVTFYLGTTALGTATLSGSAGKATATVTVNGSQLTVGTNTITAQYSGDSSFNGATATVTVTVQAETASGPPVISGLTNGASFKQVYAPGMILSVFGSQLAASSASAGAVPLPTQLAGVSATINGVSAPLYYVSAGQLNIQIPYATPLNTSVTLTVNDNGQTASTSFRVAAAAPGIFTTSSGAIVPTSTAARGQIVTLFITGDGAVTPALATGASPATGTATSNLPRPSQTVSLTVGNVPATIQFIGIPPGLVGVTQVNYQVPTQAPLGTQSVIVTVGGVASAAANLVVTQ